ncbi:hypothetical protein RIR_jg20545.t1 [Rhizophagus irregularis DAOM 181602=DAOM 197198]|nr:hypothetical protein RIR_jg20545.t1 [Rhizophagus irregularis DAOM 181602=DAOM 197198]
MCYILYDLYLAVTFAVNVTILGVKNVYNPSLDSLQMADWAVQFDSEFIRINAIESKGTEMKTRIRRIPDFDKLNV